MSSSGRSSQAWRGGHSRGGPTSGTFRGGKPFPGQRSGAFARQPELDALPSPTGPILLKIGQRDIVDSSSEDVGSSKITDLNYAVSYNWLDKDGPTIKVPGRPPTWTPLAKPVKLSQDSGTYYRDLNAAHYPKFPMEPAAQALLKEQPEFLCKDVDVVACGSTLGNILRFVRKTEKTFRFVVEAVGDTVFFIRKEKSPRETIPNVRGYGHSFPEAYTTWECDVKGSTSHQRVISYRFGDLHLLLRFESDGYLRNLTKLPGKASDLDHALFDLKTRAAYRKGEDTLAEELPRLWISQIPNFILAYHDYGVFEDIQVTNVREEVLKWERENQDTLQQFAVLLRKLIEVARSMPGEVIEVRRAESDTLELREYAEEVPPLALPPKLEARWLGESIAPQSPLDEDKGRGLEEDDLDYAAGGGVMIDSDEDWYQSEESEKDYTACSAEDCGYCGHCSY
ncbi:hypothetical protein EV356DRAFT_524461 [Viridothelium virens]|uniref:Geranylgeranyl pyrophosphate synthetase n=1 Tax=Viridothelium virens TaxID=1048519 RepID=A0A6A6H5Y2_VIRVR|nr:hypothetical protein EV356DRAFT_524461 [Viridothelium virens]